MQSQTKKTMRKAIKRYAETYEINETDCQIRISPLDEDCTPKYEMCKKFIPFEQVSFNELLGVQIDFMGREYMAGTFIKNCLKRISKEQECEQNDVSVIVFGNEDSSKIHLHLFVKENAVKPLSFDYIFGEI